MKIDWYFSISLLLFGLFIKLLLINAYFSTDFEVHRNWLAITSSLPMNKWYVDATSEWTLDYPPFFAYFEWILSIPAALFDKNMLVVPNLNYSAFAAVVYQRLSAMVTEILFLVGTVALLNGNKPLQTLTFLNPGILFVDHIHFQYNAFLTGIQLLSLAAITRYGRDLIGGMLFAVLLNFKHIYLYSAPAYFVYLLRHYCMCPRFSFSKFSVLALGVLSVFALSFAPFGHQILQVLSRLFPFKRGLTHAYWAPNFWALYSATDRVALYALKFANIKASSDHPSLTRGIVGDVSFAVLPNVSPLATLLLTIAAMLPCLYWLWRKPTPLMFQYAIVLTNFSSYMFGWHVHEKAILLVIIPFSALMFLFPSAPQKDFDSGNGKGLERSDSVDSLEFETQVRELDAVSQMKAVFRPLCLAGYYSLFPLLFKSQEEPVRVLVLLLYISLAFPFLSPVQPYRISTLCTLYLVGFVPLHLAANYLLPMLKPTLPFLSLMLISVYCSIGIAYSFLKINLVAYSVFKN